MKGPIRAHGPTRPRKPARFARPPSPGRRKLSIKSQVSRALYFAYKDQTAQEEEDQQRQQDQLALLHQDVSPNWQGDPQGVVSTTLDDSQDSGTSAGSGLGTGDSILPPAYLQAPQ